VNHPKTQVVFGGCNAHLKQACLQETSFEEGSFHMKYLGIPITSSRLSKLECRSFVDKIQSKVMVWSTRNISFTGRVQLLNSMVFGMFSYWANIFILPQEVLDQITQISRNYL